MEWMLMPLRRYADFQGRSRRMEFWMWQLFKILINFVFTILLMVVGGGAMALAGLERGGEPGLAAIGAGTILLYVAYLILMLAIIIPDIAVSVRRLHDTNRSGFWLLAPIATYILVIVGLLSQSRAISGIGLILTLVAAVALLVFYFLDGTAGDNRFGPDPKSRGNEEVFI
ncbi:DUF805 domain-containing protein [Stakelama sediminis]|uniref:Uncharacterized membrane protein YhaH (DUF805 family) n=1 Tax=Stakelama sediminis TaxID=463200 RepID=A0A840YUA1_9SPHN|nr:DUF805 domain-containing protein [Stakelama sediminis]MBB5717213.1 uncharacterized membrane protein YhaH (DUF805 family) [Stakelama sediminis]